MYIKCMSSRRQHIHCSQLTYIELTYTCFLYVIDHSVSNYKTQPFFFLAASFWDCYLILLFFLGHRHLLSVLLHCKLTPSLPCERKAVLVKKQHGIVDKSMGLKPGKLDWKPHWGLTVTLIGQVIYPSMLRFPLLNNDGSNRSLCLLNLYYALHVKSKKLAWCLISIHVSFHLPYQWADLFDEEEETRAYTPVHQPTQRDDMTKPVAEVGECI